MLIGDGVDVVGIDSSRCCSGIVCLLRLKNEKVLGDADVGFSEWLRMVVQIV
jgi:hypothetical protein